MYSRGIVGRLPELRSRLVARAGLSSSRHVGANRIVSNADLMTRNGVLPDLLVRYSSNLQSPAAGSFERPVGSIRSNVAASQLRRLGSAAGGLQSFSGQTAGLPVVRLFHSSRSAPAEDQNNAPRKSPYQVFVDTFREEWNKSKELQDNIKALQDETGKMSESEAYRKAKEAYDRAMSGTSAASSMTAETLKKAGKVVGDAASTAWESPIVKSTREAVNQTAETVDKATAPIRETQIYKEVRDVIDDGSSRRYGGFEEREIRRKRRAEREAKRLQQALKNGTVSNTTVAENPNSGTSVVLHKDSAWKESWDDFKSKSSIFQSINSIKQRIDESDGAIISTFRGIADRIGGLFAETEFAQVTRMFREIDPGFQVEGFLNEVREYILPEVIDAYVKGDDEALKLWLSEAPYNIWHASAKQFREAGLYSAGRVLDIRAVDIASARILAPSDIPVMVISCRAQEVHIYKTLKTGEVAAGTEDHIQQSTYAMVITRIKEEMDDPETKGWRILELVRGQTRDWT
ncbi:hypothetical protein V1525DRAFT_394104 [Lipomyces kononenkoae]|uniref:Uncharacterized protein n=1 Tax=Lipomyces kononenkoae TaxID=34357 RepID=A0ACC3TAA6_LIPKO